MTQLEELRAILVTPKVTLRNNDYEFVNGYTNAAYYYSKCFPVLFPTAVGAQVINTQNVRRSDCTVKKC